MTVSVGQKFGRLTVTSFHSWYYRPSNVNKKVARWCCKCDCGKTKNVLQNGLLYGKTESCGCITLERSTIHGLEKSYEYKCWSGMLDRCLNPKNKSYHRYGLIGVTVCDRWNPKKGGSIHNFLEDMGERPKGTSINRVYNVKHYSKETCEWATNSIQGYDQNTPRTNTSGRVGVYYNEKYNNWCSKITCDRKVYHLGTFKTFEKAVNAREKAEIKYFGWVKGKAK